MHTRRNFSIFAAAVAVVLVLALFLNRQVAQYVRVDDKNINIGETYLLDSTHADDLVIFGSQLQFSESSVVTGDAALIGDTIRIGGRIDGDLTAIGGSIEIEAGARVAGEAYLLSSNVMIGGQVDGNLTISGETMTILPSAAINGTINGCAEQISDGRIDVPAIACEDVNFAPFSALIALRDSALREFALTMQIAPANVLALAMFGTVALAGMSALLVTLFPRQISHIEEALRARPRGFSGVGVAVYVVAVGAFFALVFALAVVPPLGLLLVPVFLILGLLLLILVVMGMVTLALMLGDWLLRRAAKPGTPPLIAALVGSVLLSTALAVIALLPFGFALSLFALSGISAAGMGAALFTRIGTRPLRRSTFVQG